MHTTDCDDYDDDDDRSSKESNETELICIDLTVRSDFGAYLAQHLNYRDYGVLISFDTPVPTLAPNAASRSDF
jgi:hypothetical protein